MKYLVIVLFISCYLCREVVDLDDNNFSKLVEKDKTSIWFIKFYAPWCGHCKRLAPTWESLPNEINKSNLNIGKIDCTKNPNACGNYGVRGYPTLKLFVSGKHKSDFKGKREVEEFEKFINDNSDFGFKDSTGMYTLNDENYEIALNEGEKECWDILFYVPWNKKCRKSLRRFKKKAKESEDNNCNTAIVDISLSKNMVEKYSVKGVPFILNINNK